MNVGDLFTFPDYEVDGHPDAAWVVTSVGRYMLRGFRLKDGVESIFPIKKARACDSKIDTKEK